VGIGYRSRACRQAARACAVAAGNRPGWRVRDRLYAIDTPAADQPDKPAAVLIDKPVSEASQALNNMAATLGWIDL
jgi:hypothetical protein